MKKKGKNILLVEPKYRTKFPPMGLMKISTYHKLLGDHVFFVKGIKKAEKYRAHYDRIYVSTLFTYNWGATVKTINYYKELVNEDPKKIIVGGIMATLMSNELFHATGVMPTTGLLDEPDPFKDGNDIIIDNLIPDYDLFKKQQTQNKLFNEEQKDTQHPYTLIGDSYFGYTTKGCIRKCKFCGVHQLEPKFINYIDIKPYVAKIQDEFEEKYHLVLFDNNVLASNRFKDIIKDIKDLGFEKNAMFEYKNKVGQTTRKKRYVDYNQGVDARIMIEHEHKVKLLSEIAINPLRIAFDHISEKETYKKAVRLAESYGIRNFSNYILYNYDDTPEDLWKRLKLNIDLNKDLDLDIYSFPMKFIPLDSKDRSFIHKPKWNWYFLRGVQRILNVLKGTVMPHEKFFYRAFGKTEKKFVEILHMPENILMYRDKEPWSLEEEWGKLFRTMSNGEKAELLEINCENRNVDKLKKAMSKTKKGKLKKILEFYLISEEEVKRLREKEKGISE